MAANTTDLSPDNLSSFSAWLAGNAGRDAQASAGDDRGSPANSPSARLPDGFNHSVPEALYPGADEGNATCPTPALDSPPSLQPGDNTAGVSETAGSELSVSDGHPQWAKHSADDAVDWSLQNLTGPFDWNWLADWNNSFNASGNQTLSPDINGTTLEPMPYPYLSGYSLPHVIITSIVVTILMVVIVFGNAVVIIAIARDRHLKAIQNWFIASLAVSDLFVGEYRSIPFFRLV